MDKKPSLARRLRTLRVTPLVYLCALLLAFAACGTNFGSNGSGGSRSGPQSSSTQVQTTAVATTPVGKTPVSSPVSSPEIAQGQGKTYGCPGDGAIVSALTAANVTLRQATGHATASAHLGDVVEVDLSFGVSWAGPGLYDQSVLKIQPYAGDAYLAAKACMWRFVVVGNGSTTLTFTGRPICQKSRVCPQYIVSLQFSIEAH